MNECREVAFFVHHVAFIGQDSYVVKSNIRSGSQ